jgi:anti-sigma factor RsiW
MKHIDREIMEKYVKGDLGVLRKIMVVRHLKNCTVCTRLAEEIKKGNELLDSLRKARKIYMGFEKDSAAGAVFASLKTRLGASTVRKQGSV